MRPESLAFFDRFSERCLADLDEAKEKGIKIAGLYCLFAPTEMVRAVGAIPVSLCGKKQDPISKAEETLPANLCPLIKSSYGYAVTGTCPFFAFSDFIIGETTCDGKKKMFELLGRLKPLHLMQLPYAPTEEHAVQYWYQELLRLKGFLEDRTGVTMDSKELRRQIGMQNEIRRLFQRIMGLYRNGAAPVNGNDLLPVYESKSFFADPARYLDHLKKLVAEMEHLKAIGGFVSQNGGPRILLTGTPAGRGSDKVLKLIEAAGGAVVCLENCSGIKSAYFMVDEDEKDPLMAIARGYLKLPCSCMTPNAGRMNLIGRLIEDLNIQGVVNLTWQFCHTYNVEAYRVREMVEGKYGLPMLHVETDYSESDTGQLKTRIEAFLEMIE